MAVPVLYFLKWDYHAIFQRPKAKDIASEAAKKATVEESISYVKNQLKSLTVASEKRVAYVFLASLQEQSR